MIKVKIKGMIAILALASLNAIAAGTVEAAPLLNESFDPYPNGTTLDSTGNWTFFSPASSPTLLLTTNAGTVTATNLTTGVSGEDDKDTFSSTSVTTGILYYSTLVTVPSGTTVTATNGDYFFAAYSAAGGYAARVYVAQGSAAGTVALGLTTAAASGTNAVNKTIDLTLGTEYKLVLRYDVVAKTATMGLFAPGTAVTADSQLTITSGLAGAVAGVDSVAIRQGSAAGAGFTTVIDGIQVGTTLADVANIATGSSPYFNAVPEPSTYALVAVGLIAAGLLHQRPRRAV